MNNCQAFAGCQRPATKSIHSPVIGAVPACERCKHKLEPNARFWTYINGGMVKLTLTDDRPQLNHACGGATDEGFSYEFHTWELSDGVVYRKYTTDARDCDGRHGYQNDQECPVDRLSVYGFPDWQEESSSNYDQYAEMMGY